MIYNEGSYATKGCYSYYEGQYKGKIWFGTGGTEEEMKKTLVPNSHKIFRPPWFDCKGNTLYFSWFKTFINH